MPRRPQCRDDRYVWPSIIDAVSARCGASATTRRHAIPLCAALLSVPLRLVPVFKRPKMPRNQNRARLALTIFHPASVYSANRRRPGSSWPSHGCRVGWPPMLANQERRAHRPNLREPASRSVNLSCSRSSSSRSPHSEGSAIRNRLSLAPPAKRSFHCFPTTCPYR
jgi:hypothetical protein